MFRMRSARHAVETTIALSAVLALGVGCSSSPATETAADSPEIVAEAPRTTEVRVVETQKVVETVEVTQTSTATVQAEAPLNLTGTEATTSSSPTAIADTGYVPPEDTVEKSDDDVWREDGFTSLEQLRDAATRRGLKCAEFQAVDVPIGEAETLPLGICDPDGEQMSDGVMMILDDQAVLQTIAESFLEDPEMQINTVLVGKNWLLVAPDAVVPALYYDFFGEVMTRDEDGVPSFVPLEGRTYSTLTNLRDATVAAGLHCPVWELGETNSAHLQPGACYTEDHDFILSYYWSDDPAVIWDAAASLGDEEPILIGPNWLLWAEHPELIALLAPTMGGQMGFVGE